MGSYIGHCDSCDITLEAEEIALTIKHSLLPPLIEKYGLEKATEIVKFFKFDFLTMDAEWWVTPAKSIEETIAELVVPASGNPVPRGRARTRKKE